MADFLLELRSEEIPARMQKGARAELEKLFRREMDTAGVTTGDITVWSTPRRLALIARDLPLETEAVREEAKGPPVGAPDQAIDGFCRKNGVTREQLETRDVKGRATYFAVKEVASRSIEELLSVHIPLLVYRFSWPKSMRWGETSISPASLRWVRPLSSVLAILDDRTLKISLDGANVYVDASEGLHLEKLETGLVSSNTTVGHRFHSDGELIIDSVDDYVGKLQAAHVIVDHEVRAGVIREGARKAAKAVGLSVIEDEGLVVENAGLTEWPVPLLGRFDESYLDVPPEVIQLTARVNQKYFVCEDPSPTGKGGLANAFICTSNIAADDPAVVVDGNRKVLAARLSDARFFWELDQKTTLADHAKGLERITFHEKLGTVADKVERVTKLAGWLVFDAKEPNGDRELARQAGELCKVDLVTEMVGEFPELQGLMGGYYAEKERLDPQVSDAIRDHYKPVGQSDDVPTAPITVAVSLADKLDNLLSFFKIDILPTGSKDPFALRRAALGYLRLIQANGLKLSIDTVAHAWDGQPRPDLARKLADFLVDRLAVQLRDEGVRHDFINASRDWDGQTDMRIDRIEARARALSAFLGSEDGANLLAGYKRAANILKKEDWSDDVDKPLSYEPEKAEKALADALANAGPKATDCVKYERFEDAMAALALLRDPIDAFFEEVTVNDPDENKRTARLALLARFRNAVHRVADFGRIEG